MTILILHPLCDFQMLGGLSNQHLRFSLAKAPHGGVGEEGGGHDPVERSPDFLLTSLFFFLVNGCTLLRSPVLGI